MGNPYFYWYPDEDAPLKTVDFGEALSDLYEEPADQAVDAEGPDGVAWRTYLGGNRRVRIQLERFGSSTPADSTLEMQLQSMESHLARGGVVGFSRDHAKTWCVGCSSTVLLSGATLIPADAPNLFSSWSASAALADLDHLVVETPWPDSRRELVRAGDAITTSTTLVPLDTALLHTFALGAVVRWRDFWPVLRRPASELARPLVHSDRRRNFTLDATFVYTPASVLALAGPTLVRADVQPGMFNGLALAGAGSKADGQQTLDRALGIRLGAGLR